ncbi:hydroxymethylglutaryl-CoA reductase [Phytomonospora endophytica]|uniref:hydroxymethylglutaryl-CoA reductase (NADPH) n=1 Tax=Phytomonospora endophytica TaxID=714109 RepID=A0A841FRJ5_9ACTN|nr:hydroxymethylglutaryl-CoA reductase [Phytomonospora endophytica]MBB6038676.1 hydroxymethylglutaryl-CoA reductase (NADPH) [Phytomonospora endophytica]GIG69179.1 3-hydroxy-3-methylglutaryl-CoA reductase [Phytomonospora endophytica]
MTSNDTFLDRVTVVAEEIASGERRVHQLPDDLSAEQKGEARRRALELHSGTTLDAIGDYCLDAALVSAKHCENFIGAAQVPMGVVGPLSMSGRHVDVEERIFVPLATTEGALLASTARGCRAISGKVTVDVEDTGMTRAPVFRTSGITHTRRLLDWVAEHTPDIRSLAEQTSRHLQLTGIQPLAVGTTVFLRFAFTTDDAMGMNMVTLAVDQVVTELIEPQTGAQCVALSGNVCVDKKPAWINVIEGRGKRVYAEAVLDAETLEDTLKTSAEALCEVQYRKNLIGSAMAGAMGSNAHHANLVAALFLATGQDLAHVTTGATGITCVEARPDGAAYVSVYLPELTLGTVGGGTALETQKEALGLLGIHGGDDGRTALRLAEILGATVLAGEVSLLAALASRDLARAHRTLAR